MSYERSARYYDAIYESLKDYRREATRVQQLAREHGFMSGHRLLDVACGTGLHDQYLIEWYDVEGLDSSEAQLEVARQRLPHVTFHHGDMVSFDLGREYDVVTCLFSAIGHLSSEQLRPAVATMARHLAPGGVLMVEPWLLPDMWNPERVLSADFVDRSDLKIARITQSRREGDITRLEMHHLGGRPNHIEYFVEHHDLTLFTEQQYLNAFRNAGLEAWRDIDGLSDNGRGLFIGRKLAG